MVAAHLEAAVRPGGAGTAGRVAGAASLVEKDRHIRRLADLSRATGISGRTLERHVLEHVGARPTCLVHRYRLLEAAEAVRLGEDVSWAQPATDLGRSDRAHLIRAFRRSTGRPPSAHAGARLPGHNR